MNNKNLSTVYITSSSFPRSLLWLSFKNIMTRIELKTKLFLSYFKRFHLFMFREKGREGERKREKHQCVVASHMPLTGDLACDPGMCSDWDLNWQPFGLQDRTQPTELYQAGLFFFF